MARLARDDASASRGVEPRRRRWPHATDLPFPGTKGGAGAEDDGSGPPSTREATDFAWILRGSCHDSAKAFGNSARLGPGTGARLFPARQLAAAATASLLIAGAFFVCLFSAVDSQAQGPIGTCEEAAELAVLPSPVAPWKGAPLRVIFAAEKPIEGELSLIAPDGSVAAKSSERHGGPPYFWFAEVAAPAAGTWHATLARDRAPAECSTITREIAVRAVEPPRPRATDGSLWPLRNTWNRETENLYSAWIEKLFDAPLDAAPSWPALHEVLRDRSRNVLFNHLGLREDQMGLIIRPDCADLPYFLRAYFAFKMGLPFGYAKCTRGGAGEGPKCYEWWNIQNLEEARLAPAAPPEQIAAPRPLLDVFGRPAAQPVAPKPPAPPRLLSLAAAKQMGLAPAFGQYLRQTVADGVDSGSANGGERRQHRLLSGAAEPGDAAPGTVYADPYGHLLVLVRRVPQAGGAAGVFLAVDGQPVDGQEDTAAPPACGTRRTSTSRSTRCGSAYTVPGRSVSWFSGTG